MEVLYRLPLLTGKQRTFIVEALLEYQHGVAFTEYEEKEIKELAECIKRESEEVTKRS